MLRVCQMKAYDALFPRWVRKGLLVCFEHDAAIGSMGAQSLPLIWADDTILAAVSETAAATICSDLDRRSRTSAGSSTTRPRCCQSALRLGSPWRAALEEELGRWSRQT